MYNLQRYTEEYVQSLILYKSIRKTEPLLLQF